MSIVANQTSEELISGALKWSRKKSNKLLSNETCLIWTSLQQQLYQVRLINQINARAPPRNFSRVNWGPACALPDAWSAEQTSVFANKAFGTPQTHSFAGKLMTSHLSGRSSRPSGSGALLNVANLSERGAVFLCSVLDDTPHWHRGLRFSE